MIMSTRYTSVSIAFGNKQEQMAILRYKNKNIGVEKSIHFAF